MFVAEAVDVFAVGFGGEGVVAGGDGACVDFVGLRFALDLLMEERLSAGLGHVGAMQSHLAVSAWRSPSIRRPAQEANLTQKSMSRFPLPPNSLSPT